MPMKPATDGTADQGVVDGKAVFKFNKKMKIDYLKFSIYLILMLSLISFVIASKGFDILYLLQDYKTLLFF